jgi:signal transduction histidine kinase
LESRVDFPSPLPHHPISAQVRHDLFLAFKEALNNLVRHAGARQVRIDLTIQADGFSLKVEDDGSGFHVDPATASGTNVGNGLSNMRSRLASVGGKCTVDSTPGRGTQVVFEIPWEN